MLINNKNIKVIESDIKNGTLIPILLGSPGIGKSSLVRATSEKNGWIFHELLCNQLSNTADLTGCRTLTSTEQVALSDERRKEIEDKITRLKTTIESYIQSAANCLTKNQSLNEDSVEYKANKIEAECIMDQTKTLGKELAKYNITLAQGTEEREIVKQVFFPHAAIKEAIVDAENNPDKTVILFLDEINRTTSAVTSAILTFITARTIGTEKLPNNIKLIAAGNDEGNVITLDDASISRFIMRRVEPDSNTFLGLGEIHPVIEDLLKTQPALIYQEDKISMDEDDSIYAEESDEFKQITTPRTIMGLNKALLENQGMVMSMSETDLKEYVAGFTGETLFTEAVVTNIIANKFKFSTTPNIVAPPKPSCVDAFVACKKITDIEALISTLDDDTISSAILYMIYDKNTDYTNALTELAKKFDKNMLLNDDMKKLNPIINSGDYNSDSYNIVANAGTALSSTFKIIFG